MNTTRTIAPTLREDFIQLIAQQTGIEIRTQNYTAMGDNIFSRVKALKLSSPQAYYNLLSRSNRESEEEWQQFVCLLTNKESYFFRDQGQFTLLRQTILPELICRNQRTKQLKILSAGCSTGQEPYSIAILLRELIKDLEKWQITIVGVDINRQSLVQCKKASYNPWSFRQVEEQIQQRYFKNLGGFYRLDDQIKQMARFYQVNLVRDQMPEIKKDLSDMDLILCRNVFIYFTENAIAKVVNKFWETLKPDAYLITGHAELSHHQIKAFQTKMFPESIVYQRKSGATSRLGGNYPRQIINKLNLEPLPDNLLPKTNISAGTRTPSPNRIDRTKTPRRTKTSVVKKTFNKLKVGDREKIEQLEQLIDRKSYYLAQQKLTQFLEQNPQHFQAHYLMAKLQANLGKYESAQTWIERTLSIDNLAIQTYYLSAQIYEEVGNREKAKQVLKQIIYLEPD